MNKKINAFTIMEVTVAMLIAALVIGMTYTAYSVVSRSYQSFHQKNDDIAELLQLDHLLKRDFAQADTILKTANGLTFKNATHTIDYEIDSSLVIRTSAITDTFKVKVSGISTLFEEQPVTNNSDVTEPNRIDELEFQVLFQDKIIPYHYYKTYSAANLIERNAHALN